MLRASLKLYSEKLELLLADVSWLRLVSEKELLSRDLLLKDGGFESSYDVRTRRSEWPDGESTLLLETGGLCNVEVEDVIPSGIVVGMDGDARASTTLRW